MIPEDLLRASGIAFERFAVSGVFISSANQLFGAYGRLKAWQSSMPAYFAWEAHHVFECSDIERLGAKHRFPSRNRQLCVLLPSDSHRKRINQILRSANPPGMVVSTKDLMPAYVTAYSIMGNYCGGGESRIQSELLAVVRAALAYVER